MGLEKVGMTVGKEIMAWTRTSGKSLLATRPIKINTCGLKYAPALEKDVLQISKNDYIANIRKLGLNKQDTEVFENLLSDSRCPEELRQMYNQAINRPDINLNELRKLFAGLEKKLGFSNKTIWHNDILESPLKLRITLEKLRNMSPKDLEVIKQFDDDALRWLYGYGDFMVPDKYMGELSKLLKKDRLYVSRVYSPTLNKRIVECFGNSNKTYFTYDREKDALVLFKEDGTKELIKERKLLKDATGKAQELIKYEKSDIDGVFNVVKKDLNTGKEVPLSEAVIDSAGKKMIRQNLVSPEGTKSQVYYEEMPNGNTQYRYTIADKKGNALLEQVRTRTVLNESEIVYKINDKSYNVRFLGADKIEILNQETKQLDTIDLRTLLSELADTEKAEMITMLKKVPADELLALGKNNVEQILNGSLVSSSAILESGSIASIPNEFVFLHELGHKKDMVKNIISAKDKGLVKKFHKNFTEGMDGKHEPNNADDLEYINGEWKWKPGKGPSREEIDNVSHMWEVVDQISKLSKNKITKISTDKGFLKIYNKERKAYIKKFGTDDNRIDYLIKHGSGLGPQGEAAAEINAILSTPIGEAKLGTRSYLFAENFPETIAYARKLLYNC